MTERRATGVGPAKIDLVYETFGDASAPPVVLVMGGTAQLIHWPVELCEALAARGLFVVCFDNRDAGLSTHMTSAPAVDFPAAMRGDYATVSYTLSDMAADTVGLMDALGLASAHLFGASMGGMIAQTIALEHPTRVRSLVSLMSSTGDRSVGQVAPDVFAKVFTGGMPATREEAGERAVARLRFVGSTGFPLNEARVRDLAMRAFDRDHDLPSVLRQSAAVLASGDRTARLRELRVPTLVVHGLADRLCDPSGGRATAAAIPGAELVEIEGMGHDLPRGVWPRLVELVVANVQRGEAR